MEYAVPKSGKHLFILSQYPDQNFGITNATTTVDHPWIVRLDATADVQIK